MCTTVTRSFDLSVLVPSTVRLKDNDLETQEGSGVFGKVFCYLQKFCRSRTENGFSSHEWSWERKNREKCLLTLFSKSFGKLLC